MAGIGIRSALGLGVVVALALGAVGYERFRRLDTGREPLAIARIGDTQLHYDPAFGRSSDDRNGGRLDRLDLAFRFPDFAAAGSDFSSPQRDLVFMRLEAADPSLELEERMARLYVRFLESEDWTHPGGLIMRRFTPGSPFEREELYFAPPEGRAFAARCTRPIQPPDGLPETCLVDIRVNGLDAHVRFSPEILPDWERLVAGSRTLLERMTR